MCLIMFVFLWLVMLTAWWSCADASSIFIPQEQHQKSPRGTKHWFRTSASSSWREAYSPRKVYCSDYHKYCWDYSPLEFNITTWNIMKRYHWDCHWILNICVFFVHAFLTWRELLGIDCPPENRFSKRDQFPRNRSAQFSISHHWPWLSRRNLRHFLDLRRRLGMGRDPFNWSSLPNVGWILTGASQLAPAGPHCHIIIYLNVMIFIRNQIIHMLFWYVSDPFYPFVVESSTIQYFAVKSNSTTSQRWLIGSNCPIGIYIYIYIYHLISCYIQLSHWQYPVADGLIKGYWMINQFINPFFIDWINKQKLP